MTLAETQALFHEAITSPTPLPAERLEACFQGTPELAAQTRVGIYADMYLWRLLDGMRQTFPNLARFLGDETFAGLAEDYLRRHPSEHHDLAKVGRHLPAFLRVHPDPERPDLADLAELEWARQEVFFAPQAAPAGPNAFGGLDAEAFAQTGLKLSPALRVLVLDHAIAPLWRQIEDGEEPDPPLPRTSAVAVWRTGYEVFHGPLSLDEAVAIGGAMSGDKLAEVCASFTDRNDPVATAHQALSSWLAEGWIVGLADHLPAEVDH